MAQKRKEVDPARPAHLQAYVPADLVVWLDELADESRLPRARVIASILAEARNAGWRLGVKRA